MIKELKIQIPAPQIQDIEYIITIIRINLKIHQNKEVRYKIIKKSLDARHNTIKYILHLQVFIDEDISNNLKEIYFENNVKNANEIHIIGAGPSGLFCALHCIELGIKPILFERGKIVKERRRDIAVLNKLGILNEESNYCFGEGGAGTFSDGKLYTRSNKRGDVSKILKWLHYFGAEESILYDSHPHIGTNKLPHIIENIRNKIIECGGEIYFNSKLTDINIIDEKIESITINTNQKIKIKKIVLATGHSSNEVYKLLYNKKVKLEPKPFALGVRIEHPQTIIDNAVYHCKFRPNYLPPASYQLSTTIKNKGVFSFCMCPGGIIATASTQQNALVINGWSPSKRNNKYANSGIVVNINENDFDYSNPLNGLFFQQEIEKKAFIAGGGNFKAPATRMIDFINNIYSTTLPDTSYIPGVQSADFTTIFPKSIIECLNIAFKEFSKKIYGYDTNEAIILAPESRTSSAIRIPREKEKYYHPQIKNLFPCAEGAGYAGGIMSAAMDGINISKNL